LGQCSKFVSDASGVSIPNEFCGNELVRGVGFDSEGIIICTYQLQWSKEFVSFLDSKGTCIMGLKTASLEIIEEITTVYQKTSLRVGGVPA
jgi:hypothetical protein